MANLKLEVTERTDLADDEGVLALSCTPKPPPRPAASGALRDSGRSSEDLDPLRDVLADDRA